MSQNYCADCAVPIPDGQKFCSMCYGDMEYGKDGYYRDWYMQQLEEEENGKREKEERERSEMSEWKKPINHDKDKDLCCPFCGKPLVIRTGKRGEFYGCPSYPSCVYTCSIDKGDREEQGLSVIQPDYWWR